MSHFRLANALQWSPFVVKDTKSYIFLSLTWQNSPNMTKNDCVIQKSSFVSFRNILELLTKNLWQVGQPFMDCVRELDPLSQTLHVQKHLLLTQFLWKQKYIIFQEINSYLFWAHPTSSRRPSSGGGDYLKKLYSINLYWQIRSDIKNIDLYSCFISEASGLKKWFDIIVILCLQFSNNIDV